uniref:Uncharacterized protein n=1 Tax=Solanum lycopersicum TaxID=4081 RepID=A0A3Q7ER87_SOLLC
MRQLTDVILHALMFSAVSIGPKLRPKEVAYILNCDFAHEAPGES